MSRPLFLCLLIFILLLAGLVSLNGGVIALAIPLVLYVLYGFGRGPEDLRLGARREMSARRVAPDEPVTVRVTVTNHGDGLDELILEDVLPSSLEILEGSNRHLVSLRSGGEFAFEYTILGPRGSYPLETIRVHASDYFGLVKVSQSIHTVGRFIVFPTVTRLKSVAIRPRRTRVYAGTIPARLGGTGAEFFGVRDYQPGDSPRRINWRASARHPGQLYSNEFQQERVADVGIILDGRERANSFAGGRSLFEHSVRAAAALSDALLAQGNRVGLLIYGNYLQWTLPGYGKVQRERILQALTHAVPGQSLVFDGLEYLPARAFPAESQIVLVSPVTEDDDEPLLRLRARGYQVLVLSPDSVAFEAGILPQRAEVHLAARIIRMERQLMIRRLKRAGIQFIEWDVLEPLDQSVGRFLRRPYGMGNRG